MCRNQPASNNPTSKLGHKANRRLMADIISFDCQYASAASKIQISALNTSTSAYQRHLLLFREPIRESDPAFGRYIGAGLDKSGPTFFCMPSVTGSAAEVTGL